MLGFNVGLGFFAGFLILHHPMLWMIVVPILYASIIISLFMCEYEGLAWTGIGFGVLFVGLTIRLFM